MRLSPALLLLHLPELPLPVQLLGLFQLLLAHGRSLGPLLGRPLVLGALFSWLILGDSGLEVLFQVEVDGLSGVGELSSDLGTVSVLRSPEARRREEKMRTSGLRRLGRSIRSATLSATCTQALTASTCSLFLGL